MPGDFFADFLPQPCWLVLTRSVINRVLGEVVGNFPTFLEEVTLLADPECVRLKNYCKEDSESLNTSLWLPLCDG